MCHLQSCIDFWSFYTQRMTPHCLSCFLFHILFSRHKRSEHPSILKKLLYKCRYNAQVWHQEFCFYEQHSISKKHWLLSSVPNIQWFHMGIRDELSKRNISEGREDKHPSQNALEREDIKCIAQVHTVREQRKRLLWKEKKQADRPSKGESKKF